MNLIKFSFFVLLLLLLSLFVFSSNGEITIYDNGDSFIDLSHNCSIVSDVELIDGKIIGYTEEFTSKKANVWTFNFNEVLDDFNLKFYFPKSSSLQEIEVNGNYSISSYNERPVILVKGSGDLSVQVSYILSRVSSPKVFNWWLILFGVIIFGVAGFIILIVRKTAKGKLNKDKINAVKLTLNENQLQLFEVLLTKKEGMNQKNLLRMTGLPKSSVSRNLELMTQKNVILKINAGSTNYLKVHPSMYK